MLNLYELQKQFIESWNEPNNLFLDYIHSTSHLSAAEHLAIYKNSTHGALQKVLKEIYGVCFKLVGEEFFIYMINEFIALTPSTSHDLGEYGKTFSDFITTFTPANSLPYLPDVARLEWAWHSIFDAEENKTLDFEKLSEYYVNRGEGILFLLPNAASLLSSAFPLHQIWAVNQEDSIGEQTITLEANHQYYYLVWRKQLEKRIDSLSSVEWQMLAWIQEQLPVGKIAEKFVSSFPNTDFTTLLIQLVQKGYICDLSY